jgi:hypothetical protein
MGLCTFDAEGNAVEDENGACYEGGFGGSVTVVAQAPEDVIPIFVSLPSLLSDNQQPAPTAPPPVVTEAEAGVRPVKSDPPPLFVPVDILKWSPPIHPKFCPGGAFALIGNSFRLFGLKAGAYAIPAQYDSKDGGSSGFLVEVEVPHTPVSFAYEGSVSWRTGKYSNSGLVLAGGEGTSAKLGAVSAGGFADANGNFGGYASAGILGGGGYGKFSLTGDCQ